MPGVTQPTERPGIYKEKFDAVMDQAKNRLGKKFTEEYAQEYAIIVNQALRKEAEDKIEFSLRGAIRRGKHKKLQMSENEFSDLWRDKMKKRLKADGFIFEVNDDEAKALANVQARQTKIAIEEKTKMAAEALRKIIEA